MSNFDTSPIVARCKEIIECDTARISHLNEKMYLIIGFNRNTKDDEGQWIKDGEPYDFDYFSENVVASGRTEEELIESLVEYKRVCGMTAEEYLMEQIDLSLKGLPL